MCSLWQSVLPTPAAQAIQAGSLSFLNVEVTQNSFPELFKPPSSPCEFIVLKYYLVNLFKIEEELCLN